MNDLKRSLEDLIDDSRLPDPPSIEELQQRTSRHHQGLHPARPVSVGILIVVVVTGVILAVAYGPRSATDNRSPLAPRPAPGPGVIAIGPRITQPSVFAAGHGRLWVTGISPDQGGASLQEFDEKTGKVVATVKLADNWPGQIAVGNDAVWLRTQQGEKSTHLVEVNSETHRIMANLKLQKDGGLAVTSDAVWTVNGSLGLVRIDPTTGRTIATIALPGGPYPPLVLTSGPLGLFLGSSYDGSILRVDQRTNTVTPVTHIGAPVDQMVEQGRSLWVSTGHALIELPVSTGIPGRSIDLGAPILGLATDGHWLWVTTDKPKPGAFRVDPATGEVTAVALPAGVSALSAVASDSATGTTWATATSPRPLLLDLSS